MNRVRLLEELKRDEGVRLKPYICTAGALTHDKMRAKDEAIAAPRPSNQKPDCKGVTAMAVEHSEALEIWRPISGFANYEVSSRGRVRQLGRSFLREEPRWGSGKKQLIKIKPRIIKGWMRTKNGRPVVCFVSLRKGGETFTCRVHRLVLEAFIGPAPVGAEGCHNNGDPSDNRLENLRWDSHRENIRDSITHGTKKNPPVFRGEGHHFASVTDDEIAAMRAEKYWFGMFASYARKWGISQHSVGRIYRRESRA